MLALRRIAVIVAGFELSDGSCGALVSSVKVCCVFATLIVVLPLAPPTVAVTVIVVPAATPWADSVAVACPLELVVPDVTDTVPALAANVTTAPDTATLFESVAMTVRVAVTEPSGGRVAALEVTASFATEVLPAGALPPPGDVAN